MKHTALSLFFAVLAQCVSAQVTINIDLNKSGHPVSPTLYGIFFEDINHAADGGLYAELIRNRSFEEKADEPLAWKTFSEQDCPYL